MATRQKSGNADWLHTCLAMLTDCTHVCQPGNTELVGSCWLNVSKSTWGGVPPPLRQGPASLPPLPPPSRPAATGACPCPWVGSTGRAEPHHPLSSPSSSQWWRNVACCCQSTHACFFRGRKKVKKKNMSLWHRVNILKGATAFWRELSTHHA